MLFLSTATVALLASTATAASEARVSYHFPSKQEQQQPHGDCEAGDSSCYEQADSAGATQQQQQQQQHAHTTKQTQNHTDRDGVKQASKGTDGDEQDEAEHDGPLLKWLSNKMVPDVKACGVYLAPSTIPGAGLGCVCSFVAFFCLFWRYYIRHDCHDGSPLFVFCSIHTLSFYARMFAGRSYRRREVVTQGDIVIPLSEIDWHNGFELKRFLWEEYTWSYVALLLTLPTGFTVIGTCIVGCLLVFLWLTHILCDSL